MKRYQNLILILLFPLLTFGQTVDPIIMGSSGNHHISSDIQLSWTIGELVISTENFDQGIVTQGFHQPFNRCTNVISLADSGEGSLRTAIECANAQLGPDTIRFFIADVGNPPYIIQPITPLPEITDDGTLILATTQPNYQPEIIVLDGSAAPNTAGLRISANDCQIIGLKVQNFSNASGMEFTGANSGAVFRNSLAFNANGVAVINNAANIRITENSFYCNTNQGIVLNNGNNNLAPPTIVQANVTAIWGTASPGDSIEVYLHDPTDCVVDVCQGKTLLGKTQVDGSGNWVFANSFTEGQQLTAIATNATNNTSPFDECQLVCPIIEVTVDTVICEGDTVYIGDRPFFEPGSYRDTIFTMGNTAVAGCDSIVNLNILDWIGPTNYPAQLIADYTTCEADQPITGNTYPPYDFSGLWTVNSGAIIENENLENTNLLELEFGNNVLVWTLSALHCENYHTDTLDIYRDLAPLAVNDEATTLKRVDIESFSLVLNDTFSVDRFGNQFSLQLLDTPEELSPIPQGDGVYNFLVDTTFTGELVFQYEICNQACGMCDQADILVTISKPSFDDYPPTYICPECVDGDSFNPVPCLPECYPKNSIIIVNRWGDIVYRADPYEGDWIGEDNNNNPLPAGTYFYILRLDIGEGEILVGEIVLIR